MNIAFIKSALRRVWNKSPERQAAIVAARVSRGKYRCNICKKVVGRKAFQIDHIDPVGRWVDCNTFVERLFCPVSNLQLVCIPCHKSKTLKDNI